MKTVIRYLRRVALLEAGESPTDGELLESFLIQRDEAAFEALLRRHGPMVLGVCLRTLRNTDDAEDAFQATFLVLVRKASTIQPRELVGNWLYGVACRTAMKARAMSTKRRIKESAARVSGQAEQPAREAQEELLQHLDAELSRLPEKYRVPLVLCELEGKSRKEAASLLGLAEGTLSWRLAWARKLLARRLSRYGVALPATALAVETASAGVSPMLFSSTTRVAMQVAAGQSLTAGAISARVVILTEGVLKAMLLNKLKMAWAVALAVCIGAGATGLTYRAVAAGPGQPQDEIRRARVHADELDELRLEIDALRKGLQATRERLRSLEAEVQTLKQPAAQAPGRMGGMSMGMGGGMEARGSGNMMGTGMGSLGTGSIRGGGALGMSGGGALGMPGRNMMGSTSSTTLGLPDSTGTGSSSVGSGIGLPGSTGTGSSSVGRSMSGSKSQSGGGQEMGSNLGGKGAKKADDPLADAESALKELKRNPDSKDAADRLDRALQRLKERNKTNRLNKKGEPRP